VRNRCFFGVCPEGPAAPRRAYPKGQQRPGGSSSSKAELYLRSSHNRSRSPSDRGNPLSHSLSLKSDPGQALSTPAATSTTATRFASQARAREHTTINRPYVLTDPMTEWYNQLCTTTHTWSGRTTQCMLTWRCRRKPTLPGSGPRPPGTATPVKVFFTTAKPP
jgi:hypothetical protein